MGTISCVTLQFGAKFNYLCLSRWGFFKFQKLRDESEANASLRGVGFMSCDNKLKTGETDVSTPVG